MKGSTMRNILGATAISMVAASIAACAADANRADYRYKPDSDEHAVVTILAPRPPEPDAGRPIMRIEEINGQLINKNSREVVSLPPGEHSIRFTGMHYGPVRVSDRKLNTRPDVLDITVEAGKTYFVAWEGGPIVHRIDDR